jgi:hypothetical protein
MRNLPTQVENQSAKADFAVVAANFAKHPRKGAFAGEKSSSTSFVRTRDYPFSKKL